MILTQILYTSPVKINNRVKNIYGEILLLLCFCHFQRNDEIKLYITWEGGNVLMMIITSGNDSRKVIANGKWYVFISWKTLNLISYLERILIAPLVYLNFS